MSDHLYDEIYKDLFEQSGGVCQSCGGPVKAEKVNLEDLEGGKLYMMESVPALVCEHCGEMWVPEPIMKEFEKMISTAQAAHHKPARTKKPKNK